MLLNQYYENFSIQEVKNFEDVRPSGQMSSHKGQINKNDFKMGQDQPQYTIITKKKTQEEKILEK